MGVAQGKEAAVSAGEGRGSAPEAWPNELWQYLFNDFLKADISLT